jgi:hypothetical protein
LGFCTPFFLSSSSCLNITHSSHGGIKFIISILFKRIIKELRAREREREREREERERGSFN